MGSILGYICKGTGGKDVEMQTTIASLFAIQQSLFTGLDTLLFTGIIGRSMFDREHRVGSYSIVSYILSHVVVSIPMTLIGSFFECMPYILMVGWQGSYYHFWTFLMTQFNGSVFALVIGLLAGRADIATTLIPIFIVPQIYLSGMFRPSSSLPIGAHCLQWFSTLKYSYSASLIIEFGDESNRSEWTEEEVAYFKSRHLEQN